MKHRVFGFTLTACVALVAACASSNHSAAGTAAPARDVTILDSTELVGHGYANTYVAMTSTRPAWLRAASGPPTGRDPNGRGTTNTRFPTADQVARATGGGTSVAVFLEGSKQQLGVSYLNTLPVEQVALLKHLSPSESMSYYGPEWAWGAIVVRLRQ